MVSRLRTPARERPQTKFPSSSEKSPASKSPARKKTVVSVGETSVEQEGQWSQHREHTILLSRERVNKGKKRMNSLPLSLSLHDFTGKTADYKTCVTL